MAWFDSLRRMFERKASVTTALVATEAGIGRPRYTPRNYDALAREGFARNPYVFRAIMVIAQAGAAIPWKLFTTGSRLTEVDDHPLLDLMQQPNLESGGVSFWRDTLAYWYLSGNAYIEVVRPETGNRPPVELWTLRPERVRVIPGAQGVTGYRYGVDGAGITIPAANVLHLRMFNPLDDYYGMSPIVVAANLIDQMNSANDWNTALFQNSARPDGMFVTEQMLTDDQRKLLRQDLRNFYQGSRNARRPMITEGGVKWQQTGMAPTDLDWIKGKGVAAKEIALVIGVPSELMGDAQNKTYSNQIEARKALYSETVLPAMFEVRDMLNTRLVPMYDDRLRLDLDLDNIEALQEDRTATRTFALQAYGAGVMMLNEARVRCGLEEVPDGNIFWRQNTGTAISEDDLLPEVDDEVEAPQPPIVYLPPGAPAPVPQDSAPGIQDDSDQARLEMRRAFTTLAKAANAHHTYAATVDAQRQAHHASIKSAAQAVFHAEQEAMQQMIRAATSIHDVQHQINDVLAQTRPDWQRLYQDHLHTIGGQFATSQYAALAGKRKRRRAAKAAATATDDQSDDADDDWDDDIDNATQDNVTGWLNGQDKTTKALIVALILAALANGDDTAALATSVGALYVDRCMGSRAALIATVIILAGAAIGMQVGAQRYQDDTGASVTKQWVTMGDDKVRPSHADAEGQVVDLNDVFQVGDTVLAYPCDPDGDAEETLNCRCTALYQSTDGKRHRHAPRPRVVRAISPRSSTP